MRETIEGLIKYIRTVAVHGRDDFEIAEIYSCIASLYFALQAIKRIENRIEDEKQ